MIVNNLKPDSALYRRIDPDGWMWKDHTVYLLAQVATATAQSRWLDASRAMDEVPVEWGPFSFGPQNIGGEDGDAAPSDDDAAIERAREAAAEILG